jgi:hypothetical protein
LEPARTNVRLVARLSSFLRYAPKQPGQNLRLNIVLLFLYAHAKSGVDGAANQIRQDMDAATWLIVCPSLHHGTLYSAPASLPPSAVINFVYAGALLIWIVVMSPAIVSQQISSRRMCSGLVSC